MNIQKTGNHERMGMLHNCFTSHDYAQEFMNRFPHCLGNQHDSSSSSSSSSSMGCCFQPAAKEEVSQKHNNFWPNSTIMSHIGSPASAFYATEVYMGLTQYDFRDSTTHESSCNSQLPKIINHDLHIPSSYEQSGNFLYIDSPPAQVDPCSFSSNNASQSVPTSQTSTTHRVNSEGSYINPFSNLTEKERLLQLKNKLLCDHDDDDDSNNKRKRSIHPLEGNQDLVVSTNLYDSHFANLKPSAGRPSGCVLGINSSNPASYGTVATSKTRIRWTQELHDRFVECVSCLGGADKATPKAILKLMDWEGLTIFHVKSHLQKYRNAKFVPESAEVRSDNRACTSNAAHIDTKSGMQLKEALQLQLDVQRRLHEQLEVQRKLQLSIEEQAKQLKMIFDKQQQTTRSILESQNSDITSPSCLSTSLENVQVLISEDPESTHFLSKIS